ncbi:FG-GAP-like repeat-containing protein [Streptomyces sp. NPDC094049]|uniref:FG-GAP-like repeat-containing protein n=1 Tax=Streptomyces sp. NPDC094049 TaxID=3154987 RepID=UPI00332EDB86
MSVRRSVALVVSAALGVTGLMAATPTTAATPVMTGPLASAATEPGAPYEVTIAAPFGPETPPGMHLIAAGTGVQMVRAGESAHPGWQSLRDGRVARAPMCATGDWFSRGDRVACVSNWVKEVTVHDFATGADFSRFLDHDQWYPVLASDRLLAADSETDGTVLHLLGYGPDAPEDLEVSLPGGPMPSVLAYDDTAALIDYGYGHDTALVDFATGTLTPVPSPSFATSSRTAVLSADWIVQYAETGTDRAFVVSRGDRGDQGRTVELPNDDDDALGRIGVVGDWIVGHYGRLYGDAVPTSATPIHGGATRDLGIDAWPHEMIETGADGALYLMAHTDPAHRGVRKVEPGTDGVPVSSQVLAVPATLPYTELSMANGRVVTETLTTTHTLRGTDLPLNGTGTGSGGGKAVPTWTCDALNGSADCPSILDSQGLSNGVWWSDTGDGRLVVLEDTSRPASAGRPACYDCAVVVRVTTPGTGGTTRAVVLAHPGKLLMNRVHGVSGRYVHFRGTTAAGLRSIVADIETGKILRDTAESPQALRGDRLWTASATDDTVSAVDLRTGATVEKHDLGADCVFSRVASVGKWLYGRCASGSTTVVLYDREKRTPTRIQVGRTSEPRLGDGFLVSSDFGSAGYLLMVNDVRSGTRVDRFFGPLGYDGIREPSAWAVDRFGGGFAYIDSWRSVHVVGLGGVTSGLTVLDADAPVSVNLRSAPWKPRWWLSEPAVSWSLTLRAKATGRVVRTLTGGEARGIVAPSWDGKDTSGRYVANGAHTWALTVKPADGQGAGAAVSGAVSVTGGAAVRRDLVGDDGFGDLLVTDAAGSVSLYRGTGTGALSARIAGTGTKFAATSLFVPTGDLDGDRCADVHVRVGDQLRAYRPGCGRVLSASSPYTPVGSGWGQYDVLTSPGDVNGDGHADLVARQASTGDVYFHGGTADHRVRNRVRIGVDWKQYRKLVGVGDLNGDGRGDLLGVDASGVLWRYHGTSTGGVTARVKVGGGWGGYSSLVGVGDLSGDGRADLVARDTAGKLWRYSGTGTGGYGARVAVGSGWNVFKGLH